jgi:hypothetical protein
MTAPSHSEINIGERHAFIYKTVCCPTQLTIGKQVQRWQTILSCRIRHEGPCRPCRHQIRDLDKGWHDEQNARRDRSDMGSSGGWLETSDSDWKDVIY